MMTQQELFSKNLILSTEFDRYVLEHPEFAHKIPENAQVLNYTHHANLVVMFYLNRDVIKFENAYDVENDKMPEVIYVIANDDRPVNIANDQSFYKWERISEPILGEKGLYQSWKGIRQTP